MPLPQLSNATVRELLEALAAPEQWTRDQARRILQERGPEEVIPAVNVWASEESRSEHDRLEALWVCQGLRFVQRELLDKCLMSEDHRIRAAAVRVLSDWHAQLDDSMTMLQRAVADTNARVRLEAVNTLRGIGTREAVTIALHALDQPIDTWMEFALYRTVHERRDVWLPDFRAGKNLFDGRPHRIAFALSAVGGQDSTEPLADLIRNNRLQGKQRIQALVVLATIGNRAHRQSVVHHLNRISLDEMNTVLNALVLSRRNEAPEEPNAVLSLLNARNSQTRLLAIRLCGQWKIDAAMDMLREFAGNAQLETDLRVAAGESLIEIDRAKGIVQLKAIYDSAAGPSIRATAIAAWSRGSLEDTIPLAVKLFTSNADADQMVLVADSILIQREGPIQLTDAVNKIAIRSEVAKLIIDRARLTGRDLTRLVDAVRHAGRLHPLVKLTAAEIAQIIKDVPTQGDALRGKEIFERKNMQCVSCHIVHGVGGKVGPDLSSIGTTTRVADLLKSLLEPSASIKQGYNSVNVITVDGQVLSGTLLQKTEHQLRIRDAKDKEQTILSEDVEEISASANSLMPSGLTENLSRRELVDLVHYLSSLGKVKSPPTN